MKVKQGVVQSFVARQRGDEIVLDGATPPGSSG